ncbi:MAG: FtsQ-type POTRA domain-containing protein [Actinobacteria bacterium]|nr:FtsQ-type POTRA domain-containing protein [Actinomycetota bacterium]
MFTYIWKILMVVLVVGIGAGAAFWLSQSSVLAIDEIVIEGNRAVTSEEIMEKAGPLLRGQSLVRPPFDTVRGELGDFAFVEDIEFDRDFPGTIVIRVREHRPFICLAAAGGKNFILSAEGKVLAEQGAAAAAFPVLTTKEPCSAEVGRQADCPDVLTGARFLANIPVNFNYELAEVSVDNGDINAKTKSGVSVHFGSLADYELKFEVLRQLLARATAAGVQVIIDVSVPERPVTREIAPPPPPAPVEPEPAEEPAPVEEEPVPAEPDPAAAAQDNAALQGTGQEGTAVDGAGAPVAGTQ